MAEPLNATFFAFKKRDGALLLPASIAFVITQIIALAIFGVVVFYMLGGPHFIDWYRDTMNIAAKGGTPQPPPNMGAIFLILPIEMVVFFVLFVLLASFESACLRWMIRGERSGPLNLSFGADMWRVYGTYWVWLLFFVGSTILFWIVMLMLGLAAGAAGGKDNPALAGLVVFVGCIAWIVAWVYTAVRLAPAAATSVGAGHFAPLKAWSVSRGRFWALLGSFLLLLLIFVVAYMVIAAIAMGPIYAAMFNGLDWSKMHSDPAGFSAGYEAANMAAMQKLWSDPATIALYFGGQIVLFVVGIAFYVLFYGVNARAVQVALADGKLTHEAPAD